ncbi:MAG: hypothetical protein FD172_3893 [Methylocystaceae bacterium]|jgi:hypothetical protein|nr:MAG: hypothetical protein FD172_3893 [Methylocystaceae bacterium]
MRLQMRRVDHDALGLGAFADDRREDAVEDPEPLADEPVEESLVRPTVFGRIHPLQTMLDHIDDSADYPTIVNPPHSVRQRKIRRYPCHLARAEQKTNHSSKPPSRRL